MVFRLSASDNHGNIDNMTEDPDVTGNVTATNVGANVTIKPESTETELNPINYWLYENLFTIGGGAYGPPARKSQDHVG